MTATETLDDLHEQMIARPSVGASGIAPISASAFYGGGRWGRIRVFSWSRIGLCPDAAEALEGQIVSDQGGLAMGESIRVELARDSDSTELTSFLAGRGFVVQRAWNGQTALDVSRSSTQAMSLGTEVWDALTSWLAVSGKPLVPSIVGEHEYALTPPGE